MKTLYGRRKGWLGPVRREQPALRANCRQTNLLALNATIEVARAGKFFTIMASWLILHSALPAVRHIYPGQHVRDIGS
jgi:hypothetical protein